MLDNKMIVELDPHVQKVAEFMRENIEHSKLVAVAKGLAVLAPVMWELSEISCAGRC